MKKIAKPTLIKPLAHPRSPWPCRLHKSLPIPLQQPLPLSRPHRHNGYPNHFGAFADFALFSLFDGRFCSSRCCLGHSVLFPSLQELLPDGLFTKCPNRFLRLRKGTNPEPSCSALIASTCAPPSRKGLEPSLRTSASN